MNFIQRIRHKITGCDYEAHKLHRWHEGDLVLVRQYHCKQCGKWEEPVALILADKQAIEEANLHLKDHE